MRIDEPLNGGACEECVFAVRPKKSWKCSKHKNRKDEMISCSQIRVCELFQELCGRRIKHGQ